MKWNQEDRLFRLPSGDWIEPKEITALRVVSERADQSTGVISASAAICAGGSWYKVPFEEKTVAQEFVNSLGEALVRLDKAAKPAPLNRADAQSMIAGMRAAQ